MPELPEVETVARGLRAVQGRRIVAVRVDWERTVVPPPPAFEARLLGQRILAVRRRGKWLVLSLEGGAGLLVHLRMSGRLLLESGGVEEDPHTRVVLGLDDGRRLRFSDPRKFGRMVLTEDPEAVLGALGPEPLGEDFTPRRLGEMLSRRRARLKSLLLDQRFVAGLGNIYVNEILWRAGLHPLRRANTLSTVEVARLHHAIQEVLEEAIARRGSTLEDRRYVGADGQPGGFAARLAAYGRAGHPCPRCGTTIERITVGGRGTYLCPRCQPL